MQILIVIVGACNLYYHCTIYVHVQFMLKQVCFVPTAPHGISIEGLHFNASYTIGAYYKGIRNTFSKFPYKMHKSP